jgi:RNA polymerase sigma-70 factor (ECF subfamily)
MAGDQRAATALVERHAPALARFAASLGCREEVEEVVQDTFVRAFSSIDAFRGESSLRTWLFTIERRLVLDRRRADRRRHDPVSIEEGAAESTAATGYDALDGLVADETEERVREAVARLSPMQREVFLLRATEGLSYREIAELVGSTEGAARVHYHNAIRAVKESLYV